MKTKIIQAWHGDGREVPKLVGLSLKEAGRRRYRAEVLDMVVQSGKVEYRLSRRWFAEEKRFCLTKCPDLVDHYNLKLTNLRSCEQITLSSLQASIYGKGMYLPVF